ncbi:hypothetical protein [Pseudoalteromonas spongiae]|uniref:hypothetical protein n=1 Tax=Pseudoalteromonas spongiae TaxID=298657 RepID=UPI000C2CE40A|nr:hypothetical protein [Pseudoalteromonas spongiae]
MSDYEYQHAIHGESKVKQKAFVDMFKPVIAWAMNNNNQIFEQIETSFIFGKVHRKNDPSFDVTVFFRGGDNESFTFYAWRDENKLKAQKEILKKILKAKDLNEYKSLSDRFNNRDLL